MTGREVKEILLSKGVVLAELANNWGITAQTLNSRLNAKYFKDEYLKEISGILNITFENPVKKEAPNKDIFKTHLLPMHAMGGTLTGFSEDSTLLQDCEVIISPIANVDFAISIYGDSMYPEYPSGSRVLIKKINPAVFIDWGKVYVLDTCNGVILKQVIECKDKEGHITCHSLNPDPRFSDFDIKLSEIYGMYRVLLCLSPK